MLYIKEYGKKTKGGSRAVERLKKAALQGDDQAAYNVAIFYHDGKIVEQDLNSAKEWYKISADLGNERAKKELESFQ